MVRHQHAGQFFGVQAGLDVDLGPAAGRAEMQLLSVFWLPRLGEARGGRCVAFFSAVRQQVRLLRGAR
jgi:hypothetical protein